MMYESCRGRVALLSRQLVLVVPGVSRCLEYAIYREIGVRVCRYWI